MRREFEDKPVQESEGGPMPVVGSNSDYGPMLRERINMAGSKVGAKALAANSEATRISEVTKLLFLPPPLGALGPLDTHERISALVSGIRLGEPTSR